MKICIFFLFAVVCACVLPATAGTSAPGAETGDMINVEGKGYPPIRAENVAQARLMARRAAVLDAYRNALAIKGMPEYSDEQLYPELDGFLRNMKITGEEYLSDGGIKITAQVPAESVAVHSAAPATEAPQQHRKGPLRVTLEEWYDIIKRFVTIGN